MPKVSVNILTKNRSASLRQALLSVAAQTFSDYEIVVINDGSTDETAAVLAGLNIGHLRVITHEQSQGITVSRQQALGQSGGELIALLDDDDVWLDINKLQKQVDFFRRNQNAVLLGGSIQLAEEKGGLQIKRRPASDQDIRQTMLLRNNFFTSTVMFKREAALAAGGFVSDGVDVAEDYDLWLRLGRLGQMSNFSDCFARYQKPRYNKGKFQAFLTKQLRLISRHRDAYPHYFWASLLLKFRLWF